MPQKSSKSNQSEIAYGSSDWYDTQRAILQTYDTVYECIPIFDSPLVYDVYKQKYGSTDASWTGTCDRVANAIHRDDKSAHAVLTFEAMIRRLWMPAGRILTGAGTDKRVTMVNCFVNATIEDNMESIVNGLGNLMLTMQQGGGVGTDFSRLRPLNATLHRTGSTASGPLPFMDTWDAACATIKSVGHRRGAMMGTLCDTHPDLPIFIEAKRTEGRLTNFNVSILISDAFMAAVQEDEEWLLYHHKIPSGARYGHCVVRDFTDDDGVRQYVYSIHRARDLWDQILRATYDVAEPGVIFIDRINDMNNLQYCEQLSCVNPCGEQPLPPHGACNLGHVNVGRMVTAPHKSDAWFNWDLLKTVTMIGARFLDNVIDISGYPLPAQAGEQQNKRRIGLGFSGLADAMHSLGMRYGSPESVRFAEKVMQTVAETVYRTSAELAAERGSFPLYDSTKYFKGFAGQRLSSDIQQALIEKGARFGVALTLAPTGTISLAYGNQSAALEPVFAHSMVRKVTQPDGSMREYTEVAYGAKLWMHVTGKPLEELPSHMNTAFDVKVHEHIRIQEACQYWVDASISKTINLPEDISFDDFRDVYTLAYESGCKGCTTYRPNPIRGSILSTPGGNVEEGVGGSGVGENPSRQTILVRPDVLNGRTVKIRWPDHNSALYLTLNSLEDGTPYEVFINSKDQRAMEWTTTVTMLMSLCIRNGVTLQQITNEFAQIQALGGGWAEGKYWPSLIAFIGAKLETLNPELQGLEITVDELPEPTDSKPMIQCPECKRFTMHPSSGCLTCTNCGYSKCG
jgi:ribonucleoside-diphosphate reductase alpha chain